MAVIPWRTGSTARPDESIAAITSSGLRPSRAHRSHGRAPLPILSPQRQIPSRLERGANFASTPLDGWNGLLRAYRPDVDAMKQYRMPPLDRID